MAAGEHVGFFLIKVFFSYQQDAFETSILTE